MSRKTTRQLVPLKQTAGDLVDEDYGLLCPSRDDDQSTSFRCCAFLLALSHIVLGLASMAFGVAAVCTAVSGYYIGYGMWCGFIFFLTGIITWITICRSCMTNGMITTSLVFNILAACSAGVQSSLAIVAATNDRFGPNDRLTDSTLIHINRYDIYYSKMPDWFPCSESHDWPSWAAVDVLLVIVGCIEACVAVFAAALACRSICSGRLNTAAVYDDDLIPNEYPMDGSTIGYLGPAASGPQIAYIR